MARNCWVGIDNGVTGTIAFLIEDRSTGEFSSVFMETPVLSHLSYQKSKKRNMNRVDWKRLSEEFAKLKETCDRIVVCIERPMINSVRFDASLSARASLEAMLILFEMYDLPYSYVDSRAWQKVYLPAGIKGSAEQKEASKEVGLRMFPIHADLIKKHKDADALLIAAYMRKENM